MHRNIETDRAKRVRGVVEYARSQAEQAGAGTIAASCPIESAEGSIPGYLILGEVHRGGQGVVYRATQVSTGREVAIKILRNGTSSSAVDKARIDRELRLLAQLKHPNIVSLQDGGVADGLCFLVMDFVEGESLDRFVDRRKPSIREILDLMVKICDAVHSAHLRGVVHRDLKPSNIRVDSRGEPRVLDFGLAKLVDGDDHDGFGTTYVTITGQFVGSLPWAAPEQVDGNSERIDVRTDVYALGVILFVLTTGKFPYQVVGSMKTVMDSIVSSMPARPSMIQAGIDQDLETIVLKCLSKDRERRYESAGALAKELRRYLAGDPIEARRDSTWYVLSKMARRHRAVSVLLVAILAITAAYGITMTVLYGRVVSAESARVIADENSRERLRQTYDAVKFIFEGTTPLARISGAGQARRALLVGAFDRLAPLVAASVGDAKVVRDLANAHHLLCDIAEQVGDIPSARGHCGAALKEVESLSAGHPGDLELRRTLAFSLVRVGDMAKAEGNLDECRSFYARAMQIHEQLLEADPSNIGFLDDLIWSHERLGDHERLQGNLDLARDHHEMQLRLAQRLLSEQPTTTSRLYAVYSAQMQLATVAKNSWDWTAWGDHLDDAAQLAEQCVQAEPRDPRFLTAQHNVWTHRAEQALLRQDRQIAQSFQELAHQFALDRYDAEPDVQVHQSGLVESFFHSGVIAQEVGDSAEAEMHYRSALELGEKHGVSAEAVGLRTRLADLADQQGNDDAAQALRFEAFQLAEQSAAIPGASGGTILILAGAARDLYLAGSDKHRQVAIDSCRRAESGVVPLTPQLWFAAACIYEEVGESQHSKRCLGEALNRMPIGESPLRDAMTKGLIRVSPTAAER